MTLHKIPFCAGAAFILTSGIPASAGSPPAVTNGEAIRQALLQAHERRIDVVGIADSNQAYEGIGWDHGIQYAMVQAGFEMYATGILSANENNGLNYGLGFRYKSMAQTPWADGTLASSVGAPPYFESYAPGDRLPTHRYCYAAEDVASLGQTNNGMHIYEDCPVDISQTVRGHICYGRFGTRGDGEFNPQLRLGTSPWTSYLVLEVPTEGFILDVMAEFTMGIPPDPARKNTPFQMRFVSPTSPSPQYIGRAFTLYQRIENADQSHGFSYHTWAFLGGASARDFGDLIINDPVVTATYKQYYFQQVRRLQVGDPIVIFWINFGLNDRNETLPSIGPLLIADGDSPVAYADNLQGIINQIRADWIASGGDLGGLYFVLMPSHPIDVPDDAELVSFREAAADVALANANTAAINFEALTDADEMLRLGDFDLPSTSHLTQSGYERLGLLAVEALLAAPLVGDLDEDGFVGFNDLLLLLAQWGDCNIPASCAADLNRNGAVGFDDLLLLLLNWSP